MALNRTKAVRFNRPVPTASEAGCVTVADFTADFSAGVDGAAASANILEIGMLPAHCTIVDAQLIASGTFGSETVKVGLISGEYGAPDNARTLGDELFATGAVTGFARLDTAKHATVKAAAVDRGIGIQPSANIAAGAKKLTLRLFYRQ
jgi:hypothetical protein